MSDARREPEAVDMLPDGSAERVVVLNAGADSVSEDSVLWDDNADMAYSLGVEDGRNREQPWPDAERVEELLAHVKQIVDSCVKLQYRGHGCVPQLESVLELIEAYELEVGQSDEPVRVVGVEPPDILHVNPE